VTPQTINPAPTQPQTGQGLTVDQIAGDDTVAKKTSVEVEASAFVGHTEDCSEKGAGLFLAITFHIHRQWVWIKF
jgi:hypothetical protein